MKKFLLGLLIIMGFNSNLIAQMALLKPQIRDTVSNLELMSPSCDSVANFTVTSPTPCDLVINANGPLASLTTEFHYIIKIYQNNLILLEFDELTLPLTIPLNFDAGLYKVTCQAYCCDQLTTVCGVFPNSFLAAPLQKRWIEVKPPILGTITALSQPLGNAFQSNSFQLNWSYISVPAPSNCAFQGKRYIVEIKENGNLIKTEIIATNYSPISKVFDGLQPCKTYQVKITPQEAVNDNLNNIRWYSGTPIIKNDVQTKCCDGVSLVALHEVTASSITVKWQSNLNATAQTYKIDVFLNNTIIQTYYKASPSTQQQTLYQAIPNLIQGTTYNINVTSICSCGVTYNQACAITGTTAQVTATTPGDPCSTPATLSIAEKTINKIKITWNHAAYSGTKKYVLSLKDQYGTSLKDTIIVAPTAAATLAMSYFGLTPATNYIIDIHAQCCPNEECVQSVSGTLTTIVVKTNLNIAPECNSKPTSFSFSGIDMTSVKLNWSGLNTAPLSNTGRRFIVIVPNGPSFVVSSGTQATIGSLQPNTTYQVKIREVFDGNANVYTLGCNEVITSVKTSGLTSLCDSLFTTNVFCDTKNSIVLNFNIGDKNKYQNLSAKVRYKNVTSEVWKNNPTAQNIDGCSIIGTIGSNVPSQIPFMFTTPNIPWIENIVAPATNSKHPIVGLNPCNFYEIEVDLIATLNGYQQICKTVNFNHFFKTRPSNETVIDDDNDGIPDQCDDNITTSSTSINLASLACQALSTVPSVSFTPVLGKLDTGVVVEIAKFPMKITKVSSPSSNVSGIYSGEGVISLPMGGKKLKVTFTNIGINSVKKVFSGVVEGVKDNPANYTSVQTLIANSNSISSSKVFCNKNPQNDAFDQNGIHKGTGLPWDQNGFGPNGQYIKYPPYDGYIKGDPYDPNYNPQGFDSNGKFKDGGLYNTFGCDVNGKKKDGSACDTVPPPYYWLSNGGSPSGIALANLVGDSLKPFIQQGLQKLMNENSVNLLKQRGICGTLRSAVRLHNNTLKYDSLFTFGDNSKWINVGMNKYFKSQPEILKINVVRNSSQDLLENKHKELYACDVLEYTLVEYKDIILLLSSNIDPLVAEFRNRIKNMMPSEADKMMPNKTLNKVNFKAWLDEKLFDKVQAEFKIKNKTVDTDTKSQIDEVKTELAALDISPQMTYTKMESAMFDFAQGREYINDTHRGFIIEAMAKERDLMLGGGSTNVHDAELLPLIIKKNVLGKEVDIYFDELKITPQGGLLDAYFILDPVPSKEKLVFKAGQVNFAHTGFPSTVKMSLATNKTIPWSNVLRFTLKGTDSTYVAFDCDGFQGMGIEGEFEFCRNYLKPLDPKTLEVIADETKMVKVNIVATMPVWSEVVVNVNISPFAVTGFENIKWQVEDAVFDLSDEITPSYVKFPNNYNIATSASQWRGFYLRNLSATLPKNFANVKGQPVTIAAHDLIIDEDGVSGQVSVSPLFSTKDGNAGGWGFSIDTFSLSLLRNKAVGSWFNGYVQVPVFGDKDTIAYRASVLKGGIYQFALKPKSNIEFKAFYANGIISPSTTILMEYVKDSFYIEANLTGLMSIKVTKLKGLDSISFQNVVLCNKAPYFLSAGSFGKPKGKGSQLLGFGINLHDIGLVKDSTGNSEKAIINFGLDLNLTKDTSINITAGGSFRIKCGLKIINKKQQWWPESFLVKELKVGGSFGAVEKLEGIITFFDEYTPGNTLYGKGFRGAVDLKIKGLAQVRALALFGKTTPVAPLEGYKYFFVDAMATFDKGVPIFTGVDLKGFGGGVYHRMSRDITSYNGFSVNPPSILTLPVGSSLSGIKYIPDDNKGIGIKLSVIIASTGNETAFNANATFEILFNSQKSGGGISDMWLYGIAQFMSTPDKSKPEGFKPGKTPPPTKYANTIAGYVDMHYNFNAKEFNGLINAYINMGNGAIKGGYANNLAGSVEMRFSPNTWYINIGRPEPDKRIKLLALVPGTTIGLNLSAYLDIGKNIPKMPALPAEVTNLLGQSNFLAAESQRASGKGFAFGAAVKFDIPRKDCCLGVRLFYGEFHAGAGFDIMMQDYGKTTICTNTGQPIGINGWYAAGQMYAYIQGNIGIYALGKTYPIMDIGAAALLQAKLPNPFWAKGVVGGHYRILGGLVKGDCRFQFEVGQSCAIAGNTSGGADPIQDPLIVDINPISKDSSVSVLDKPNAMFSVPINQTVYQNNILREVKITKSILRDQVSNEEIPGEIVFTDNNTAMTYEPFELLRANTAYKYELTATEYENGYYKRADKREVTFKTGDALAYIPTDNVAASYPMNGMYNLYVNESKKGYIELKNGQSNILSNVPNGYIPEVVFRNSETNIVAHTAFTYNAYTRNISFVLPWLPKENTLKMDVQFTPSEPNANPKILYTAVFRTSMYGKFVDKINAMKSLMTSVAQPNSKVKEFKTMIPEPFDQIEIYGTNGQTPLIDFISQLSGNNWLKNDMTNFLYRNVPISVNGKDINLTWKNVGEDNFKSELPEGGLELTQKDNTAMVTVNTNQVGQILTLNPEQRLRFELLQVIDDDYKKVKAGLGSLLEARYEFCRSAYCNNISYTTISGSDCAKYTGTTYSSAGASVSCQEQAASGFTPKLISIANSSSYPIPPAAISTNIDIQYRLPGKGGITTVTTITGQN